MLLHTGSPLAPHDALGAWSFEPAVVAGLGISAAMYWRGSRVARARAKWNKRGLAREQILFAAGWTVLALSLLSPLHAIGGVLFSAHMAQHELMMTIAAPLIVLGRPLVPMLWSVPIGVRRGAGSLMRRNRLHAVWRYLSHPVSAWLLHGFAIWIWHAPALYDASVTNEWVHTAQHMFFLGTALLFWWSLLHSRDRARAGLAVIFLFTTAVHTSLLGVLLTVSDAPLYSAYASTQAWGLTALEDQQLGGIIMWVPGGIPYVIAGLVLFLRWIGKPDESRRSEREPLSISPGIARAASMLMVVFMLSACGTSSSEIAELTGGSPHRGRDAIRKYGCQSCHTIPGVRGAQALVGPPLAGIADRSFIAGVMTNSPDHMIEWLRNPPGIDEKTAMPDLGVTEKDARDIAAYLYTLR